MKFLLDQDVYSSTGRFLASLGHDVVTAAEIGLSRAADEVLLKTAQEQGRIFVTRDRDFGSLVFIRGMGAGVLYLRVLASNERAVHAELERVLDEHTELELRKTFVVIEPAGHRFRRPAS